MSAIDRMPEWLLLHVPHDSTQIPEAIRPQFVLSDAELELELIRMTDHHTHRLFAEGVAANQVVRFPVSRLVLDVERFVDDADEPMAARGMGVVYTRTSHGTALRRTLNPNERAALVETYYQSHHRTLTDEVATRLNHHGRCLLVDCHSFPQRALPYEHADTSMTRPDICIGMDDFHTPPDVVEALLLRCQAAGYSVAVNQPFSGALVPLDFLNKDPRVTAVMVEVSRHLYCNEATGEPIESFGKVQQLVGDLLAEACGTLQT